MTSSTSIGRGPAHGGNENHDGDPTHTTMGEGAPADEAPAGSGVADKAAPGVPSPAKGGPAARGIAEGPQSHPDGADAQDSRRKADDARGHVSPDK